MGVCSMVTWEWLEKKLKNFTSGDMFDIEVKVKIGHEEPHESEQTHDPLSLEYLLKVA